MQIGLVKEVLASKVTPRMRGERTFQCLTAIHRDNFQPCKHQPWMTPTLWDKALTSLERMTPVALSNRCSTMWMRPLIPLLLTIQSTRYQLSSFTCLEVKRVIQVNLVYRVKSSRIPSLPQL